MIAFACLSMALVMAGAADGVTLTFDRAVSLAEQQAASARRAPSPSDLAMLRRGRLPNVRIEAAGNSSRTLDLFSEGPFAVRYATSVLAFDYPLWDGGATAARMQAAEKRLRRWEERGRLDDSRFEQLLAAFGALYLAQRQEEIVRPFYERLSSQSERSAVLLASGEISNLHALETREAVLAIASQLLEIEAQRIEASTRLRLLTGAPRDPSAALDPSESIPVSAGQSLRDDAVDATTIAVDESRARLREIEASRGFRAMLSGSAGIGSAQSRFRDVTSDGSFGVYAFRLQFSYPLFGGSMEISRVEARADLERSLALHEAAIDAAKARFSQYDLRREAGWKRIGILRRSIDLANEREASLVRLVRAGVRSQSDLDQSRADRMRRELDLLAANVELWKVSRLLARMTAAEQP